MALRDYIEYSIQTKNNKEVAVNVVTIENPTEPIGTYHMSTVKQFQNQETCPVASLRKRTRPRKHVAVSS